MRCVAAFGLLLAACGGESAPAVALPACAHQLPGHTVAVVWRSDGAALDFRWPALPAGLPLQPAPNVSGATALLGERAAVSWPTLADSGVFRRALGDAPAGDVRGFVDLQQIVDLLPSTLAATGDRAAGLSRVIMQRAVAALRLRSLTSLAGALQLQRDRAEFAADLRCSDVEAGLVAVVAASTPAVGGEVPAGGQWQVAARGSPEAAAAIVRELVAGDGDDTFQLLRELLRGRRMQAGLAALAACDGAVLAAGGTDGWLWARIGVRDARALGDALDDVAQPASDGWQLGDTKLRLVDAALLVTLGEVPTATTRFEPSAGATFALRVTSPAARLAIVPQAGGVLRLVGELPSR